MCVKEQVRRRTYISLDFVPNFPEQNLGRNVPFLLVFWTRDGGRDVASGPHSLLGYSEGDLSSGEILGQDDSLCLHIGRSGSGMISLVP